MSGHPYDDPIEARAREERQSFEVHEADRTVVAAVLATVLAGRYVRVERPKTPVEGDVYGAPEVPQGGAGVVASVTVNDRGEVLMNWDWGMSEILLSRSGTWPLDHQTFWVGDPDRYPFGERHMPRRGGDVERWLETKLATFEKADLSSETARAVLIELLIEYRSKAVRRQPLIEPADG